MSSRRNESPSKGTPMADNSLPATPSPSRGKGLTRDSLVKAALAIVDRDGLSALSMRKLGAELGVDPMAAYRHLPNKEALLDGVVEAVVSETAVDVDGSLPWQEQLRVLLNRYLAALLAHPNALPIIVARPLRTAGSLRMVEKAFEIMADAGVPLHDAALMINATGLLTVGLAMAASAPPRSDDLNPFGELPAAEFPVLLEAIDTGQMAGGFDELLEFAVGSFLSRLEAHV